MPPRWLSIVIVVFWLTTSALFFRREWWPYLEPDAPPPFTIDLLDEARDSVPGTWKVSRNGEPVLTAKTNVDHNAADNTFTLWAEFQPPFGKPAKPREGALAIQGMSSRYRVTPEGRLLHLNASATASYLPPFVATRTPVGGRIELSGDVVDGRFSGRYHVEVEGVLNHSGNVSVPVSSQGAVLLPLHPLKHIYGLRPGQRWRVPVVDPLDDLQAALLPGGQRDPIYLDARVLAEPQPLSWGNQQRECLVIEYSGEEMSGRTWVRRPDGLVLQQEVSKSGDTWTLRRD